jgi:transcriptional regulator GlxA family with amidase domain
MRTEILVYDGFDELDAVGPFEVLAAAGFEVALVADGPATEVVAGHGLRVGVDRALSERPELLIVPGGAWAARGERGAWAEYRRGTLPEAIARRHAAGTRVASVCTGAMLLGPGGLVQGRPATTHHVAFEDLAGEGAEVIRDARVVDDGDLLSAGGVTSGLDLALWLVEREQGAEAAARAAARIEHTRDGRVHRGPRATG